MKASKEGHTGIWHRPKDDIPRRLHPVSQLCVLQPCSNPAYQQWLHCSLSKLKAAAGRKLSPQNLGQGKGGKHEWRVTVPAGNDELHAAWLRS